MDAISRVAFGLNVNSQKEKNNKFVNAINNIFGNSNNANHPAMLLYCKFYLHTTNIS